MRLQSPEYRGCSERTLAMASAGMIKAAAVVLSMIGFGGGISQVAAQEVATEVAYVEAVSGRVIAFARGTPILLDALDIISDRTRLDLQANSELHICHYRTQQLLALKGPSRASISEAGVTAESGKVAAVGTCASPVVSGTQAGLVTRGMESKTTNAPLPPASRTPIVAPRSSTK